MNQADFYDAVYEGIPRWDIDFPQPAIINLRKTGKIKGPILDVGCGTGENTIYLAKKGHSIIGMDISLKAIEKAQSKADVQGVKVKFLVDDALALKTTFNGIKTVIDSCLYHCLSKKEVVKYVRTLKNILPSGGELFLLCFSEFEPHSWGPRRIQKTELINSFSDGWRINYINRAEIQCRVYIRIKDDAGRNPSPPTKKVVGWFSHMTRI